LESIFISLTKMEGTDYRPPDVEIYEDLSWKEFKDSKVKVAEKFSPRFREWVTRCSRLHDLPPLDVFSRRFFLCPNHTVPLLCREVFARIEDFIVDETVVSLPLYADYMEVVDKRMSDQSNPVFTREFLEKLGNEPQVSENFPFWPGLVIDQIYSSVINEETDLRYLLPDVPLDRHLPPDLLPDVYHDDYDVDHHFDISGLD